MKTFTFFLRDESIHEVQAGCADEAFRALCRKLNRSWVSLHPEALDCLAPAEEPTAIQHAT